MHVLIIARDALPTALPCCVRCETADVSRVKAVRPVSCLSFFASTGVSCPLTNALLCKDVPFNKQCDCLHHICKSTTSSDSNSSSLSDFHKHSSRRLRFWWMDPPAHLCTWVRAHSSSGIGCLYNRVQLYHYNQEDLWLRGWKL